MTRRIALVLAASGVLLAAAILTTAALASPPGPQAKPTTRDVCAGLCPYASIQAAINASADGDIIRVAGSPGSVYAERLVITKTLQILGGFSGPSGPNPWQRNVAAYATVIDGQNSGTVVSFSAGAATFEGFTVTGGHADVDGGGILIEGASPLISGTTIISNNAVSSGGGVAAHGGAASLVNSTIMSNTAMGGGGLLLADGANTELLNTTVANNQAYLFGGGLLIVNSASPRMEGCLIRANRAPSGGGIQTFDALGTLTNSQVTENAAQSGFGGGISLKTSSLTIESSSILSNTASLDGGGIMIDSSAPAMDNCTIRANHARKGGGVYVVNSLGILTGNTILANVAEDGSGGGIALDGSAPTLDANSVIGNIAAQSGGGIDIRGRYCPTELCDNPASATIVTRFSAASVSLSFPVCHTP